MLNTGQIMCLDRRFDRCVPCIRHASGRIHKDLKAENVMVDLPAAESPILALHPFIYIHLNFT